MDPSRGNAPLVTAFGSLERYRRGEIETIRDDPANYVFSNVFDVAARSAPYEKVVVGKNLECVIEVLRAEGSSPWFAAPHDEFALVMDGCVEIELAKLDAAAPPLPQAAGSATLDAPPTGPRMGWMRLRRGHQALLPKGAAYRFSAPGAIGVIVLQTLLGPESVQKWRAICYA